jgi:hypothetical protein
MAKGPDATGRGKRNDTKPLRAYDQDYMGRKLPYNRPREERFGSMMISQALSDRCIGIRRQIFDVRNDD